MEKKEEPGLESEFLVRTALKSAGYTVGHLETQGGWDEDKTKFAHGTWGETRLPAEESAK